MIKSRLPLILPCILLLTISVWLLEVAPAWGQANPPFIPGELLLKFKAATLNQGIRQVTLRPDISLIETGRYSGWVRLQVEAGREAEILAALQARPDVAQVTYNYPVTTAETPDDPSYNLQWHLHNTGQSGGIADADIDAPEAWEIFTGSDNIVIGIIDTGVDLDHPDLVANLVPGYDFVNNDNDPNDDNGHGTHVAGIAAARGNNGQGVAGVSWRAKIMPLKMLNSSGGGSIFDLAEAITYAADNGVNVINMSLAGLCNDGWTNVEEAIAHAVSKDVLLIAATGNQNTSPISCPAGLTNVVAVGATNKVDTRWFSNTITGSNYGDKVEVVAPGDGIYSTASGGGYKYLTGTSMAAPQVAGLAALIWSAGPSLSATEVKTAILDSSDDLMTTGWDQYTGQGRINARRAIEALSLQVPAKHSIWIDDLYFPITSTLAITTANPEVITWTATITPTVSWLTMSSQMTGTISAASSPLGLSLVVTRPLTYATYSTNLVLTGTTATGARTPPQLAEIEVLYIPEIYRWYMPILLKE